MYGEARDTFDEADLDRISENPNAASVPKSSAKKPTLSKFCFDQLEGPYGKNAIMDTTRDTHESIRVAHIENDPISKLLIHKVTRIHVIEWVGRRKGTPPTIRRIHAFLSKMFSLAVDQGLRKDNPAARLSNYLPRVEERENRVLSAEECVTLSNETLPLARSLAGKDGDAGRKRWIEEVILFDILTGLRRSEVCRMQWGHLKGSMLHIPKTKTHRARTVALSPEALEILQRQPKRSPAWIFTYEDGRQLNPHAVTRAFKRRKDELGIPAGTRLQDMRGTGATLLLEQGTDVRAVMELYGHSKPETLLKMYARSNAGRKEGEVIKLSSTVFGRKETPKARKKKA